MNTYMYSRTNIKKGNLTQRTCWRTFSKRSPVISSFQSTYNIKRPGASRTLKFSAPRVNPTRFLGKLAPLIPTKREAAANRTKYTVVCFEHAIYYGLTEKIRRTIIYVKVVSPVSEIRSRLIKSFSPLLPRSCPIEYY